MKYLEKKCCDHLIKHQSLVKTIAVSHLKGTLRITYHSLRPLSIEETFIDIFGKIKIVTFREYCCFFENISLRKSVKSTPFLAHVTFDKTETFPRHTRYCFECVSFLFEKNVVSVLAWFYKLNPCKKEVFFRLVLLCWYSYLKGTREKETDKNAHSKPCLVFLKKFWA